MRKVLSFVLVLALVLGSFSMAFGLTDISESDNSEAISVANNLGIITGFPDGTFKPDQAVNRAEFAAMITRALGVPESALAGFSATSFKDTSGYTWAVPYLAFCESKGIMLGDGMGNAMPGRTISLNEAITMVLRAVGYTENSSVLVGAWPANYVTLAQDLDLYSKLAAATTVDRANAAQVIYNALTVQKVQVATDGTTAVLAGVTMLTAGLNCEVRNNGNAMVVAYEEDALINVMNYVGTYAKVYENEDNNIVAISNAGSVELTGTFSADPGIGGTLPAAVAGGAPWTAPTAVVFTAADGTEYNIRTTTKVGSATWGYNEFVNGDDVVAGWTAAGGANAYTINVKLSGKTIDNLYSIEQWTVDVDGSIVAADLLDIEDGALFGEDFDLDGNDEIVVNSFSLVGVASLDDIAVDDVVYVYTDGTVITKVVVGTETVSGVVTKVNASGSQVTIDGKVYKYAVDKVPGVAGAVATNSIAAGDEVELMLDAHGYIYDFDKISGVADKFAVVVDHANDTDKFGNTVAVVRLVLTDGTVVDYDVDVDKAANITSLNALGVTAGGIVKYSLNSDGEVDDIVPQTMLLQGVDTELFASGYYNGSAVKDGTVYFTADVTSIGAVAGAAQWKDKDIYDVATFDNLKGTEFGAKYVLDTNGRIAAMLLDADATAAGAIYGVVTSKYTATDADGDKAYYITALVDGNSENYEVTATEYGTITLTNNGHMQSLYKIDFSASGKADFTAVPVVSIAAANAGTITTSGGSITSANSISISGNVIEVSGGAVTSGVLATGGAGAFITVDASPLVYIYNATDQVYEKKSLNALRTTVNTTAGNHKLLFFVTDKDDYAVPNIILFWQ